MRYLEAARSLGDGLIVGVNTDASVVRLGKGPGRPLNPEGDRARLLAALTCVDRVVLFAEDTPLALITILAPDILVKGGDYQLDEIVGREVVLARGRPGGGPPLPAGLFHHQTHRAPPFGRSHWRRAPAGVVVAASVAQASSLCVHAAKMPASQNF